MRVIQAVLLATVAVSACATGRLTDTQVDEPKVVEVEPECNCGQTRIQYVKRTTPEQAEADQQECMAQSFVSTNIWLDFNRQIFQHCMELKGYHQRVVHVK